MRELDNTEALTEAQGVAFVRQQEHICRDLNIHLSGEELQVDFKDTF